MAPRPLGQKFQRSFNKQFGFGPRNQHVARHFKIETKEFLMAGDVLQWLPLRAPLEIRMKPCRLLLVNRVFGVAENKRAISIKHIRHERSGFATSFGHAGLSQLVRSLQYCLGYEIVIMFGVS